MTDHTASPNNLAEYERFRRESRIVEGDDPETPRECVAILDRVTAKANRDAREYAHGRIDAGERVRCWTARYGVMEIGSMNEWDAAHGRGVIDHKGDA
jgi:hypothetical protein